jgi:Fe-S-cluster-containing hydrogenase component 2
VTACVAAHGTGLFGNHLARLSVVPLRLGQNKVYYCTLCKKCIDICPTNALRWDSVTGAVSLDMEACTACDKCVEICPTHVVFKTDEGVQLKSVALLWVPVICDLCSGDPACARICPTRAISVDERLAVK